MGTGSFWQSGVVGGRELSELLTKDDSGVTVQACVPEGGSGQSMFSEERGKRYQPYLFFRVTQVGELPPDSL